MPDFIADGVRLRYEMFGEEGPVVVLLNGIAMSIGHWKPFIEALGTKYRFLCHDMRGQALSDRPKGDYNLEGHIDLKHEGFSAIIADAIRGARLKVLPGAGHVSVKEQPIAVASTIQAFLSDLPEAKQ